MRPHGIMFHHFHGWDHPAGDGSLSAEQFADMLVALDLSRILPAGEWVERFERGTLEPQHLCLTFDDNLRCQFDVALPVLRELGLTAFWFVTTAMYGGETPRLEVYRTFRILCFDDNSDFYEAFFRILALSNEAERVEAALRTFQPDGYLAEYPFYREADRRFRYVRDEILGRERYERIMDALIASMGLTVDQLAENLWMTPAQLRTLHDEGHVIGLHTHTHPTRLAGLALREQQREYRENQRILYEMLGQRPVTMSHPCNSYTPETLALLRRMGVRLGFRANMRGGFDAPLECPREDHANILWEMRTCTSPYSPATSPVISA